MYKFAKIRIKGDTELNGCWYFIAKNQTQLREHLEKYAGSEIKEGVHQLAGSLTGEFRSHWTNNFASFVALKCDISQQSYITQAILLENELFQNRLQYLKDDGQVFLCPNLTVFGYTPNLHEIIEEVDSEKLVYPDEVKPTIDDVRFLMWGGGKHWYAKIGSIDIVDENNNQKWDNKKEVEDAAIAYINKHY